MAKVQLEEVHRILRPNGLVVVSSVMNFPIHDCPYDYWRFTPEGLRNLLRPFSQKFVGFAGDEVFPHTVVGIGFKGSSVPLEHFIAKYEEWRREQKSWKTTLKLFAPPVLLGLYREIRKKV